MVTNKKRKKEKVKLKVYTKVNKFVNWGAGLALIIIGTIFIYFTITTKDFLPLLIGVFFVIGGASFFNQSEKEETRIIKCERFEEIKE